MTTETKYTPGPWVAGGSLVSNKSRYIAVVQHNLAPRELDAKDYSRYGAQTMEELDANARLIAAAPDLLKAVEQFVDEFERGREWVSLDSIDMAVRAIRKAKGKS
ncbi:MAG: hypothetical protein NXI32_04915 [bacterium]|nr:hypothetical protein [bacterium]